MLATRTHFLFGLFNLVTVLSFVQLGCPIAIAGEKTLDEMKTLTFGSDPLHPDPESLLGRYLSETGATALIRTFLRAPASSTLPPSVPGPEKLVVAVSDRSFTAFSRYFSVEHLLFHYHTPRQDTLNLAYHGRMGAYANHNRRIEFGVAGTLLIPILFSEDESRALTHFFNLASVDSIIAREPWNLKSSTGESYAPTDGYAGECTYWFGNIPVGAQQVSTYEHANKNDANGTQPFIKNLVEYSSVRRNGRLQPLTRRESEKTHLVWSVPGRQQLGELLGQREAKLRGELANPGWVAYTLLGSVGTDRVPVVFRLVPDHTLPMDPNFDPLINAQ